MWGGCTILQPVSPCTKGAGFLSSTVSGPMVVSRAFKASVFEYVVLYSTNEPHDFYFVLQKRLPDLSSYLHYKVPSRFLCYIRELSLDVTVVQIESWILCDECSFDVTSSDIIRYN